MVPVCWLCGSVRGELRKGTMASASISVLEKATPPALTLILSNSTSPHMSLCFWTAALMLELRLSESQ